MRYDRRGHGKSGVPKGPYTMERLGRDVLAVLDGLGIKKINWCGLSMGGMVGQWLGANAPDRIDQLVLTNTSSYFADKTAWNDRIKLVREKGVAAFAGAEHGALVHQGLSRARAGGGRAHDARCSPPRRSKATSPAARRCATWTTARSCRRSRRRPWSSPAGTIRRPAEANEYITKPDSRAPSSRCSTPRISPMSSSRTPIRHAVLGLSAQE